MAPSAGAVIDAWYSEFQNYDYDKGSSKNGGVIGHFTQLVWKSTTEIGCAVAEGTWNRLTPSYFICCNYVPEGNLHGQYTRNVLKPNV